MVEYAITKLVFSGGQEIGIEKASTTILVGANSAGKSRALRDISQLLLRADAPFSEQLQVVKNLETTQTGNHDEWLDWLRENFQVLPAEQGRLRFRTINHEIDQAELAQLNDPYLHARIGGFLTRVLNTESRLGLTQPVQRIDPLNGPVSHEFHSIQLNDELLFIINKELQLAFKRDLILYHGGSTLRAYTGEEPARTVENDRLSTAYLKELAKLPPLESDGDGIRSFIACLLATKTNPHKIFLIDEPEVFLHPPQARRLGALLAEIANQENRQIIISTHSSDIIKGILSASGHIQVCRIERKDTTNMAYTINNRQLRELWSKPLLKSTDAIQGIFHKGVIVCESDSDCRFYENLLTKLDFEGKFAEPPDVHFVHGGGKGELATLAKSYKQLHIPVAVIADFDILHNSGEFKKLVTHMEGDFNQLETLYKRVLTDLNRLDPSKDKISVALALRNLANEIDDGQPITSTIRENIDNLLQETQEWSEPKKYGVESLRGGSQIECSKLVQKLANIGLFLVPVGELESWHTSLSTKKSEWIKKALETIDTDNHAFLNARKFVQEIVHYLEI